MLRVEGLTRRFGAATAVDDLTFTVGSGQLLAMMGPNGAGKSTALNCLAGLLRPDGGAISWEGRALGSSRGQVITLIPETPTVYNMLTVWEHLVFVARGAALQDGWESRAEELLARFEMTVNRDKLGEALSKGMRQKLLVCCGVLGGAPVLMLDEPMIGLDPQGQRELRRMLEDLRSEGRTLVVSSHLLGYLDGFCDRVLIMKEGHTVASGTLDEVRGGDGGDLEATFFRLTATDHD